MSVGERPIAFHFAAELIAEMGSSRWAESIPSFIQCELKCCKTLCSSSHRSHELCRLQRGIVEVQCKGSVGAAQHGESALKRPSPRHPHVWLAQLPHQGSQGDVAHLGGRHRVARGSGLAASPTVRTSWTRDLKALRLISAPGSWFGSGSGMRC